MSSCDSPLISIVIPVYNVEKYLYDCLSSVLEQTYKNIEIILVDDGSNDSSGSICDSFSLKDHRVRVFHISNAGVSNARNLGINESKGEYIQFVDSDDRIEKGMTEMLYNSIKNNNVDLPICGYSIVKSEGVTDVSPQKGIYDFDSFIDLLKYWMIDPIIGSPCNKLFSKDILMEHDLKYEPNIFYAEDYLFNIRYLKYINRISVLSECPYKYNHMTVGSLHQINNADLDLNWKTSIQIVQAAQSAIKAHEVFSDGFVFVLLLYFITSNTINRIQQYSKNECIEWLKNNRNVFLQLNVVKTKFSIRVFPRYPRVSLAAIFVNNILENKLVWISCHLIVILYKIRKH